MLAGRKLNAVEACNYGLVTEVFPQAEFETEVNKRMKYLAGLPPKVYVYWVSLYISLLVDVKAGLNYQSYCDHSSRNSA